MNDFKKLINDFVNDTIAEEETNTLFKLIVSGEHDHEIVECFTTALNRQSAIFEGPGDECAWIDVFNLTKGEKRSLRKGPPRPGYYKKEPDRILCGSSRSRENDPFQRKKCIPRYSLLTQFVSRFSWVRISLSGDSSLPTTNPHASL